MRPFNRYTASENDIRFIFRGVRLADDKTLRELQVPDGASLVCITPTRTVGEVGGQQQQQQQQQQDGQAATVPQAADGLTDASRRRELEERHMLEQERAVAAMEVRQRGWLYIYTQALSHSAFTCPASLMHAATP